MQLAMRDINYLFSDSMDISHPQSTPHKKWCRLQFREKHISTHRAHALASTRMIKDSATFACYYFSSRTTSVQPEHLGEEKSQDRYFFFSVLQDIYIENSLHW